MRKLAPASPFTRFLLAALALEAGLTALHFFTERTAIFDFDAYMEQVAHVAEGERNYSAIAGDTGPLVYPGGHVAVFAAIKAATGWDHVHWTTEYEPKLLPGYEARTERPGGALAALQACFGVLYLAMAAAWLVPVQGAPWHLLVLIFAARRARHVFVLGLFNDGVASTLMAGAVFAFSRRSWAAGCVAFSAAVGVKMNNLLYAPGVALLLLHYTGPVGAVAHIALCGVVQLALGAPFLATFPAQYLAGAFNLGRQFDPQWSVNFNFLPPAAFASKPWALALLGALLLLLALFAMRVWGFTSLPPARAPSARVALGPHAVQLTRTAGGWLARPGAHAASPFTGPSIALPAAVTSPAEALVALRPAAGAVEGALRSHILLTLAACNVLGVVLARSLHFQFLVWYWHPVLLLLTHCPLHWAAQLAWGGAFLLAWDEHPPTPWSSALLTVAHVVLVGIAWHAKPALQGLAWRGNWRMQVAEDKKGA